uniref:DUF4381 domain-containing protein n=1 Tax=Algoriphagus sp. TaxID=1872435 RepID=UPI0025E86600
MMQVDRTQVDTLAQQAEISVPVDIGSIYEPPAVSFSFETIGWAILGGLFTLCLLILVFFLIKRYLNNRYRREALVALQEIESNRQAFPQIFVILKSVAIQVFGREKVGNLYGNAWLIFLDKTGKEVGLLKYEQQIIALIYQDTL